MPNWTEGYVSDVNYTFGYFSQLNPLRMRLAFLNAGIDLSGVKNACELGFGQGISLNIHSASDSSTIWYGTDFNPSQAAFALELAKSSGSKALLYDQSFVDFCLREDLPQFDFICLHGIWSWITDESRKIIVDFIHRKLAVGGVLYISYNTLPGWAKEAPIRQLLKQYADSISGYGSISRLDSALDFVKKFIDTNPIYAAANPQVLGFLENLQSKDRVYLSHEYLNENWKPFYFSDTAKWLEPAKLSFVCSSDYFEHVDGINLTLDQQKIINSTNDPVLKQTIRDYAVNKRFRQDYWLKGVRKLDSIKRTELLFSHRLILTSPRVDIVPKIEWLGKELLLDEAVYVPILDALSDHKIRSISEIESAIRSSGISFAQLLQSLIILTGMGHVQSVHDDDVQKSSLKTCQRLNNQILLLSRANDEIGVLASPVTGGGIQIPRFQQLFLLAILQGKKQPQDWVDFAWKTISSQGQAITKDGKPLLTPEENITVLQEELQLFERRLPIFKALLIA